MKKYVFLIFIASGLTKTALATNGSEGTDSDRPTQGGATALGVESFCPHCQFPASLEREGYANVGKGIGKGAGKTQSHSSPSSQTPGSEKDGTR